MPKKRNDRHRQNPENQQQPQSVNASDTSDASETSEDMLDEQDSKKSGSDANSRESGANAKKARAENPRGAGSHRVKDLTDDDGDADEKGQNGEGQTEGVEKARDSGRDGERSSDDPMSGNRGVRSPGADDIGSKATDAAKDSMKGKLKGGLKGFGKSAGKSAKGFGDGLLTGVVGGAKGIGGAIMNGATGFGKGFVHTVNVVTGKVGSTLGISKLASGILVGTLAFGGIGGAGAVFANYQYEQYMLTQEYIQKDDCAEDVEAAFSIASAPTGDDQAMQDANAAKAWSVFKALGLTDEQAAGAIGNMVGEGGLSPYTMEADFITAPNEKWYIGPIKTGFIADLNSWTLNNVFPYYDPNDINEAFYGTSRHGYVAGVGLCGFTGSNYDDLEDWAAGLGTTWYDEEKAFDVQMSFIIAPGANGGYGGPGGASDWLANWGHDTSGCSTPEEAAVTFCIRFEGISKVADAKKTAANRYYNMFKGTKGDSSYADSIQMAQTTRAGAAGSGANKEADDCGVELASYDNSDLARAAVAYAYKTKAEGRGNDGTELYQALHRAIFPGDTWFQSCDRGVATAVRWSGADDNFPAGATGQQLTYLNNHPEKWEALGASVTLQDANELQPGDICVCDGHIVMYVGNDIIKEKFPDADSSSDFVSASLNERSPGCGHDDFHSDSRPYMTFRLKQYETNSQYTHVVDGQNLNDR